MLLALSNYYNIKESKLVLKYLIKNVNILKNREEGKLCVAYAYFAISKYHELLMEFNKVGIVFSNFIVYSKSVKTTVNFVCVYILLSRSNVK